ncbi:META domain-containing protein [uncultured Brachyspira sp.]|uniref:META domain-containing protein n=2 Tax=uncultured Brachyspira sp. TaxID=221953 RepID=UPI0025ED3C42|nr:META domain-containing protein [uncultured Brachyspira sp.]
MKYIISFCTVILFIYSCTTSKDTHIHINYENDNNIFGRKFKLINMYANMNITIQFEENTIFGSSNIGNYTSSYTADGDIFNIISISSKRNSSACREESNAENNYFSMLKNATSYEIKGKYLIIYTLLSSENLVFEEI